MGEERKEGDVINILYSLHNTVCNRLLGMTSLCFFFLTFFKVQKIQQKLTDLTVCLSGPHLTLKNILPNIYYMYLKLNDFSKLNVAQFRHIYMYWTIPAIQPENTIHYLSVLFVIWHTAEAQTITAQNLL